MSGNLHRNYFCSLNQTLFILRSVLLTVKFKPASPHSNGLDSVDGELFAAVVTM